MTKFTNKLKIFWIICIVTILSGSIYLTKDLIIVREEMEKFPWMRKKPFYHFYYMILSAIIVTIIKTTMSRTSEKWLYKLIERNFEKSLWEEKKSKVVHIFVSTIFYSLTSAFGLYLVWGDKTIPKVFFGGREEDLFHIDNWPNYDEMPNLEIYYIVQMGSKLFSFVNHFVNHRDHVEFTEMALHHFLTVFSMIYSYFTNFYNIGIVVLVLHEFGDWSMNFCKFLRDIVGLDNVKGSPFFGLILYLFVYFRVVAQFQTIITPILKQLRYFWTDWKLKYEGAEILQKHLFWPCNFMLLMVLILYILNFIWSVLVLRVLFNFLTKRSFHNDVHGEKDIKLKKDT